MAQQAKDENAVWTPANVVTLIRILLVPVFVVAIISPWPDYLPEWIDAEPWKPWVAAAIFAAISCTDALDGYLARSRGEVTNFGKFIDPLADKILVCAALLALTELRLLPSWVALIIIAREFIVSGLRMLVATKGVVVAASWYGKAKTVLQIIAILMFIVKGSEQMVALHEQFGIPFYALSWLVMLVALVFTIVSMVDYFKKCAPILGFGKPPVEEGADDDDGVTVDVVAQDEAMREQAAAVVALARERGARLSTAESCTGGLICGTLTAVPGSSEVVEGGVVSYSNEVKAGVLGVSTDDLATHGAVSAPVAAAMATGSRRLTGSDVAVSVTGIAGPGGGSAEKPVGTVWFGVAYDEGVHTECRHFPGDREEVRRATVDHALALFATALDDSVSFE